MEFREVERTLKSLVGRPFTGKAVVRFADGKIIACDVGEAGQGMPFLTPGQMMERCINVPKPIARPDDVREAEEAEAHARQQRAEAHDAYFQAQDKLREIERQARIHSEQNGSVAPVDPAGKPIDESVVNARVTVDLMRDNLNLATLELQQAIAHCSEVTRAWREGLRISEVEQAQGRTAELAAVNAKRHRGMIATALKNLGRS